MSFLRNRAGIIIVFMIGFAIVAFLVGDAIKMGSPFWRASQDEVGEVAGQSISIQDFNSKVEVNTNNFKQQMRQNSLNSQMTAYVLENTWEQTVSQLLMDKEINRLGLQVGKTELNDLITGKNPDPQIVQNFGDPKTGQIDRMRLNGFLEKVKTEDPNSPFSQQATPFLLGIRQNRLAQKFNNLVINSVYVTSLEAREDYNQRNKLVNFHYVSLDYSSIPDNKVKLTDQDYKNYYNENKSKFKNPFEKRTFEYVVFDASPSKADSVNLKSMVAKLETDFKASNNDSLFVTINSETKIPVTYLKKGQLDPAIDSLVFSAQKGAFIAPVFNKGSYIMAKVLDVKVGPDSVKASHILLNPATEGGLDKAKSKADSIKNLLQKGASFAELAMKFGTDATKDKGGELGTFSRGQMIPEFENPVFDGKTGDLKVITTQFGVHIVKIDSQTGSSKVVKAAVVDKALISSNKTHQEAYSKASLFLSAANNAKAFDEQSRKSGYNKLIAENIPTTGGDIPGLDNPRGLIRWAFKAKPGDVSNQILEINDKYVVAKLVTISEKGILPLDQVKKQIESMVRNQVKAKILSAKLSKALSGSSSINQVAQKVGKTSLPVENVVFANPVIPGLAQENKVVGAIFGSKPGKLSKAIEGENGVYVFVVDGFINPAPLTNTFKQKEQMVQNLLQRAQSETFKVLRNKADIKDNRIQFF
ncbi:MAG: SurA N-terminal domain-containing protein [Daejeonella sp.]